MDFRRILRDALRRSDPDCDPAAQAQVDTYVRQALARTRDWTFEAANVPATADILQGTPERQAAVVLAVVARMDDTARRRRPTFGVSIGYGWWAELNYLSSLVKRLMRRDLPFTSTQLLGLLRAADASAPIRRSDIGPHALPLPAVVRALARHAAQHGWTPELRQAAHGLYPDARTGGQDARRLIDALNQLLTGASPPSLKRSEPWSRAALEEIAAMPEEARTAWQALLGHARASDSPRPSAKWSARAREMLAAVGAAEFVDRMAAWASLAREPRDQVLDERNAPTLKGLAWCCGLAEDPRASRAAADLCEAAFRKVPGVGARSTLVGNACIAALAVAPGAEAVGQLARLRLRVKYAQAQQAIEKALEAAARRAGLPREDLEELLVPTCGLEGEGTLCVPLGDWSARARVDGARLTPVDWIGPDGRARTSAPAALREAQAQGLKDVRKAAAEIGQVLAGQRHRVERLLLSQRRWLYPQWRERYLDHPLLASLSRRLVWHFRSGEHCDLAAWLDGRLVDCDGRALTWLSDLTEVRLWHPLGFEPETVLAWRSWLEEHQVTQPFKQAHREVYIRTGAEVATGTYSNRFAAHVLKQHQLNALCRERGWRYALQGCFDSGATGPTLALPAWGLTAEYWVEGGADPAMSDAGIFLHVATDQVRFREADGSSRPLSEVPALVFSEAMRDVDLFVAVCSVANDPEWRDRGDAGQFGAYWHEVSFGDLSATAETRRQVLERLIPRLRIASRCRILGRFLVVRGDLRSYKIHLGSGNILMEPNDQYLCIVPDRKPAGGGDVERLYLPFEGDRILAIIVSKALLLADDRKITDPVILQQIAR